MALFRPLLGLAALAFVALIVWAAKVGDFSGAGAWLIAAPWGIVTLVDLYIGFVIIALFECKVWRTILWIAPLPILGNVWTLVWLAFALPELTRRLRRSD